LMEHVAPKRSARGRLILVRSSNRFLRLPYRDNRCILNTLPHKHRLAKSIESGVQSPPGLNFQSADE
jgi:hypothetical protein